MNEDRKQREKADETMCLAESTEEFYKKLKGSVIIINNKEVFLKNFLGDTGNMGQVFRSETAGSQQDIAVKILSPTLAVKQEFVKRFENEAETMLQLPPHPNIVRGLFYGRDQNKMREFLLGDKVREIPLYALGMECVEGESLKEMMEKRTGPENPDHIYTPLPISQACRIITQIGEALVIAHEKRKLHRDIKPANILIDREGNAKLTDFGLVKEFGAADQTAVGMIAGTPLYMAPEQIRHVFSFSSDTYELGATLYHIITGHPPFDGIQEDEFSMERLLKQIQHEDPALPRDLNQDISEELQDEMLRALAKEIECRHLKTQEFVDALKSLEQYDFSPETKQEWLERNKGNTAKTKVFGMLFSKGPIDIRQEAIGTTKTIIDECREIEKEQILTDLQEFRQETSGLETQMRSVENLQRLIRITRRNKENVLERKAWLESTLKVWDNLLNTNPDLVLDKGSTQNKRNWEEKMREKLGVEMPEPPKTFWEKHWQKLLALAFTGMAAVTIGALGHIYGVSQKRAREQQQKQAALQQAKEEFSTRLLNLELKIKSYEFKGAAEEIKSLTALQGKIGEPGLEEQIEDIEELLDEKKQEQAGRKKQREITEYIQRAYEALKQSGKKDLTKEERDAQLQKAADLSKKIEEAVKGLEGKKAEYFRRELDIIIGKIGPQMYAFETLHNAESTYQEAEKKYESLLNEWQKGKPVSQGIIAALRREITGSKEALLRVERDFKNSRGKKTPAYTEALQETESLSLKLRRLHQNISFGQLSMAQTRLNKLKTRVQELKQDKKYFAEENAVEEISRLEQEIQILLSNIEGSEFLGESAITSISSSTQAVINEWQPIKEKIENAGKLEGLSLAEYYFNENAYSIAEKQFSEIDSDRAKLYLSAIRLERRKETEKILVRGGITQNHLEEYKKLTSMLEQEETGQTPRYIMESMKPLLERFSEIPELYFLARDAKDALHKLDSTAWSIDPAGKDYKAKISEFITAVKKEKALTELEKAAEAYLIWGEKEQKPVILSMLAETYAELGRKEKAIKNYEALIESSIATPEDKERAKEALNR